MLPSGARSDVLTATPGSLDDVFQAAGGGDVVRLADGDYGTFRGDIKPGMVTLTPEAGATVKMALDFDPAANITIDGVRITDATLADSRTNNITVRNSDIPGQVTFRTDELANANILFERNVHRDWNPCGSCVEARVWLPERTSQPSGITIRDSEFTGGIGDGIQNGSNGTVIAGNTFHDIDSGGSAVHTDAIQLFGSRNTVIRNNYFFSVPDAIMATDGADHETITDNVVAAERGAYPFAFTLFSDQGSTVRHNTFAHGSCDYDLPCGILRIGAKSGDPAGRDTVVKDNIVSKIAVERGSLGERSHNLLADGNPSGTADIEGLPTYLGGANPASLSGFELAAGSLGSGSASDGLDRGAVIDGDGIPLTPGPSARCKRARSARHRARVRLRRADGHHAKRAAKHHLRRVTHRVRRVCR